MTSCRQRHCFNLFCQARPAARAARRPGNRKDNAAAQPHVLEECSDRQPCLRPKRETCMNRPVLLGALTAFLAVMTASLPLLAAGPLPWPWKSKLPPDPALVQLTSVEGVTVVINKSNPPTVGITVSATAPTPNYTELQLTPRMGDPKDLIFAFDAKGRPPQDMTIQITEPVTFSVEYIDAPLDKVGVIEVNGASNCKAFSVTENKATECTSQSAPQ